MQRSRHGGIAPPASGGTPRRRCGARRRRARDRRAAVSATAASAAVPHSSFFRIVPCAASRAGGGVHGLISAINGANAAGGGTIRLAGGCVYRLTSVYGNTALGPNGPDGLPPITTPIMLFGRSATIEREDTAPAFRILEVNNDRQLEREAPLARQRPRRVRRRRRRHLQRGCPHLLQGQPLRQQHDRLGRRALQRPRRRGLLEPGHGLGQQTVARVAVAPAQRRRLAGAAASTATRSSC